MSDKNTRRGTAKATEYENRMDQLDQAPSKPPIAAWDGEEAGKIVQKLFDPGTDATKLFESLMGSSSPEQRKQGRKPSVQHSMYETESVADRIKMMKNSSEQLRDALRPESENQDINQAGA